MSSRFPPIVDTFLSACKLQEEDLAALLEKHEIPEALFVELIRHAYYDHRATDAWGDKRQAERAVDELFRRFIEAQEP